MLYWLIKKPHQDVSPAKVSKVSKAKEIPKKGQKAAPKLVDNQSATKHALLADQTATTLGVSPANVPKVSKAKEIPKRAKKLHQNWLIIRVLQRPWHPIVI